MFRITKTTEVSACHFLKLPYESKCTKPHGHNWKITVVVESETLNNLGMVMDFSKLKKTIKSLDHRDLNKIVIQPTAENIAKWLCDAVERIYSVSVVSVEVEESEGNVACYLK